MGISCIRSKELRYAYAFPNKQASEELEALTKLQATLQETCLPAFASKLFDLKGNYSILQNVVEGDKTVNALVVTQEVASKELWKGARPNQKTVETIPVTHCIWMVGGDDAAAEAVTSTAALTQAVAHVALSQQQLPPPSQIVEIAELPPFSPDISTRLRGLQPWHELVSNSSDKTAEEGKVVLNQQVASILGDYVPTERVSVSGAVDRTYVVQGVIPSVLLRPEWPAGAAPYFGVDAEGTLMISSGEFPGTSKYSIHCSLAELQVAESAGKSLEDAK